MNTNRFIELIKNPETATGFEWEEVETLVESYPYSQILRTWLALKAEQYAPQKAREILAHAAVYTTDRAHLKTLVRNGMPTLTRFEAHHEPFAGITPSEPFSSEQEDLATPTYDESRAGHSEGWEENEATTPENTRDESYPSQAPKDVLEKFPEKIAEHERVIEEIQASLRLLQIQKKEIENIPLIKRPEQEEKPETGAPTNTGHPDSSHKDEQGSFSGFHEDERFSETGTDHSSDIPTDNSGHTKSADDNDTEPPEYLRQMPSYHGFERQKSEVEDERQEEQRKIIDNFINKAPTFKRIDVEEGPAPEEQSDLSLTSARISDELVSENLAIIYLKQGKADKAIEIYKKLIWKFPQKKAYFASRIEELKNQ